MNNVTGTPPPPGNITSISTPPQIFNFVSQSLGIDSTILFIFMFSLIAFPLLYFKFSRTFFSIAFLMYCFFGVYIGIVPIWIMIFGFTFFSISTASSIFKFISGEDTSRYTFKYDDWKPTKIEVEEEPKTENCKNCGGPNVNRTTCQYCGLVLE